MKRVLVIEDNAQKEARMREVCAHRDDLAFTSCKSIKVAYPLLASAGWDLVLLDMTFQVNQGLGHEVRKEPLAGLEILQFMKAKNIGSPVIVVTQHSFFSDGAIKISSIDELDKKLTKYFRGIYRSTLFVDLSSNRWQKRFLEVVEEALNG